MRKNVLRNNRRPKVSQSPFLSAKTSSGASKERREREEMEKLESFVALGDVRPLLEAYKRSQEGSKEQLNLI